MRFNPKQSKAKEILWLAVAAMSLATGIHKTINYSFLASWYYFIFVLVALSIFLVWRNKRINGR
ncbi:MAG: hypothetical protein L3J35_12320 [Bacteroidales bacterium]|nr:hypothetical protein [Bacteroidales bacterium]